MSGLIRRLRNERSGWHLEDRLEAADEIERLRGLLRTGSIGNIDGINKTIYTSCDKCGSVIPHPAFEDKP